MKTLLIFAFPAFFMTTTVFAADDHKAHNHSGSHDHSAHQHNEKPKKETAKTHNTVSLSVKPAQNMTQNTPVSVTVKLTDKKTSKPITFDDLKEVHTEKLHLLIIDNSLTDYHHIHPKAGQKPGEYVFDFTPRKDGAYHVWADIVPTKTGKQEYVKTVLSKPTKEKVKIDKTVSFTSTVDGYSFTLSLDGAAKSGQDLMANITISKDGKPFDQLEPVMGAFAHVVGFSEDGKSVLHIHPMGKEPEKDNERGGPKLEFHISPEKPGFVKLFAQVRIGGKDIFAPFGINVE